MHNERQIWLDRQTLVSFTIVDVQEAAQALIQGHLCGPAAGYVLTKAVSAAALLGAELERDDETVSIQMKCSGPVGGFNVECTAQGTLRGYTEKKILDEFDIAAKFDDEKIIGREQIQIVKTIPGKIISQAVSSNLQNYLTASLQRKARIFLQAAVDSEAKVRIARGVLIEAMPDSKFDVGTVELDNISVSPRTILARLGMKGAEKRETKALSFACRCSPERATAMLAALSTEERAGLPPSVDITCHMCGRTWTIPTESVK